MFSTNAQGLQTYELTEDREMGTPSSSSFQASSQALLYNLSTLNDKVRHARSLISFILSPNQIQEESPSAATVGVAVQEIITAASSMMPVFQRLASDATALSNNHHVQALDDEDDDCTIIELEEAYLLAKHTSFCEICGKGFKRDANLRMHMRAHGDEYKTNKALRNPANHGNGPGARKRHYSCPAEGCKWNKRHKNFQPLKSLVCAKNHYKRSHCPKMYVCKRCDSKQFAVLSDLRTHEKHCGDAAAPGAPRWRCSCGSTFSRKEKLMGHAALFADDHTPILK